MMDKNKQIEEMGNEIQKAVNGCASYWSRLIAEHLTTAGYRKASEVAEEIFAEIDEHLNLLDRRHMLCGNPKQSWGVRSAMTEIAELKKKYTEGEDTE